MSKCKYLIDISPYDSLCDHPCRLYGGGAVEAECETCQYHIEDLERENAKLRDDLETQREAAWHNTKRNAREYKRVCDENDQLRELVRRYSDYTDQDRCEGCVYKSRCNDGYVDECWQLTEIRVLARKLGIEVDG